MVDRVAQLVVQVEQEQRAAAGDHVGGMVVGGGVDVVRAGAVEPERCDAEPGGSAAGEVVLELELQGQEAGQSLALAALVSAGEPAPVLGRHEDLGDLGDQQVTDLGEGGPARAVQRFDGDARGAGDAVGPGGAARLVGDVHLDRQVVQVQSEPVGHDAVVAFAGAEQLTGQRRPGRECRVVADPEVVGAPVVGQPGGDEGHDSSDRMVGVTSSAPLHPRCLICPGVRGSHPNGSRGSP
jgi:hypothetical protein